MVALKPSDVRAQVLEQHMLLGQTLDRVQRCLAAILAADSAQVEPALELERELCAGLWEKINLEDELLRPALREADAWGEIRAAELGKLLAAQKAELVGFPLPEDARVEPRVLAARMMGLIETFRQHMIREEAFALQPDVLRDDIYGIDVEDG